MFILRMFIHTSQCNYVLVTSSCCKLHSVYPAQLLSPHKAHDLMIMTVMHGCIFCSTLLTVQTSSHVAFLRCVALVTASLTHVWHCHVPISTSLIGGYRLVAWSREVLTSLTTTSLVRVPIIFVGRGVCRVLKHMPIQISDETNSAT